MASGFEAFRKKWALYSERSDLTGLSWAAQITLTLTVAIATIAAIRPATRNIHHWSEILYAKSFSQLFMPNQAMGDAIVSTTATNLR